MRTLTITTSPLSINSIAESNDRPEMIQQQIAVPLATRVSDKMQSKIWFKRVYRFRNPIAKGIPKSVTVQFCYSNATLFRSAGH